MQSTTSTERALMAQLAPALPDGLPGGRLEGEVQLFPDKQQLKDLSREGLEAFCREIGEKPFRAEQVFNWMYVRLASSFEEMSNLPKALRARLEAEASLHRITPWEAFRAADGTTKVTFRCHDGAIIESVWIPNEDRNTLCVSSQVGCAMACSFCLTAKMGLVRNLSPGEIVEQVVHIRRMFPEEEHGRLTNIVMMGMGEPLHNYDNVLAALKLMTDPKGLDLSNRKVTVSTSGLVPAIEKLGQDVVVNLAVSLNATTDALRDELMPVNKRWPLAVLMEALRRYPLQQRRRITFEYVLLRDRNDSLEDAARIIKLLQGIPSKINLIPWNPHPGGDFARPEPARVERFLDYLRERNLNVTIRETRGLDSMAACGQLGKPGERLPKRFQKKDQPAA
jgi:23S rRNA (adenine2503-C2)-methyltransferase